MWSWLTGNKSWARKELQENGDRAAVSELRQAWPRISAEFERARRYERSVTVAVFAEPGDPAGTGHDGRNGGPPSRAAGTGLLANVLASATREIDLVTCHDHCCVVVMPEIGTKEGEKAVRRMRDLCARRLDTPIEAGIAVFPADGWVFLDLVEVARRNAADAGCPAAVPADDGRAHEAPPPVERVGASLRVERAQGT